MGCSLRELPKTVCLEGRLQICRFRCSWSLFTFPKVAGRTQELELRSPYLVVVGDVRAWGLLEEELRSCTGITLAVVTPG